MSNARDNRGKAYRESSFWDTVEAKKKEKEGKKNG